jgi:hypothetical protein
MVYFRSPSLVVQGEQAWNARLGPGPAPDPDWWW